MISQDLSMFMLGELDPLSKVDATLDPLSNNADTTTPARSFLIALQSGIKAGKASFLANRQNATIIDVTAAATKDRARKPASSFYMLRTSTPSKQRANGLSPEAQRTKELLLSGPHSPLYAKKEEKVYGI